MLVEWNAIKAKELMNNEKELEKTWDTHIAKEKEKLPWQFKHRHTYIQSKRSRSFTPSLALSLLLLLSLYLLILINLKILYWSVENCHCRMLCSLIEHDVGDEYMANVKQRAFVARKKKEHWRHLGGVKYNGMVIDVVAMSWVEVKWKTKTK